MDIIDYAMGLNGLTEWKTGSNPKINQMFADAGHPEIVEDDTSWCAAFVGHVLKRCGYPNTGSLLARSYLNYGQEVKIEDMQPGDIIIWKRGTASWQGHVEFVLKKQGMFVKVIGGNVQDKVTIRTQQISNDILGVRRPIKIGINKPTIPAKPVTPSILSSIIASINAAIAKLLGAFK